MTFSHLLRQILWTCIERWVRVPNFFRNMPCKYAEIDGDTGLKFRTSGLIWQILWTCIERWVRVPNFFCNMPCKCAEIDGDTGLKFRTSGLSWQILWTCIERWVRVPNFFNWRILFQSNVFSVLWTLLSYLPRHSSDKNMAQSRLSRVFNYQAWTKEVTRISLIELDLENMAEGNVKLNISLFSTWTKRQVLITFFLSNHG